MITGKHLYRILVVGGSDNTCDSLSSLLPKPDYEIVYHAENAAQARRAVLSVQVDLVIIVTPLKDEYGTQLAIDMADDNLGVLLLVSPETFDQVCSKVEDFGVMTMTKPVSRRSFYSYIRALAAMRSKLLQMERKQQQLQEKMMDIRTVNRAKWLLIERLHMTEDEAHHYIEKRAMDLRLSRREAAETIIQDYIY